MSDLHLPIARLAAVISAALGLTLGAPAGAAVTHETCAASRLGMPARLREPALVTRPTFAELANLTGTAGVRVDLAADGTVLGTYVVESTGSQSRPRRRTRRPRIDVRRRDRRVHVRPGFVSAPRRLRRVSRTGEPARYAPIRANRSAARSRSAR